MEGYSEKQIAYRLNISQHTVHVYVKAIYREFDVVTRQELLSLFITPKTIERVGYDMVRYPKFLDSQTLDERRQAMRDAFFPPREPRRRWLPVVQKPMRRQPTRPYFEAVDAVSAALHGPLILGHPTL